MPCWSTRAFLLFLLLSLRNKLLLFAFVFLSLRSVEMSSYWDGDYVFGQYSSDNRVPKSVPSGVPDSNDQEEVMSSIQGKQNRPFLDLNTHPPVDETSPVDDSYHAGQPGYPAQQGYPDYGYGCENSYVQQHYPDGYG
ncbi:hypothetical protein HanXRQr2_Chr13g0609451 [Helianthus annuus]|uniref:Uncharacterized protein n=1 Tax=Helianthus annuus TaxID=4232 RepID=A0A9K3EK27_HELAN|nr:hypothetical protein HanXRQr2_Chr13g0609451 [Helianthus annuus]KAJ0478389.1 hypothetical protein HanHA300_Chr13g0499611 [Helianthus annuus]KAJ0483141.1 hypothetical protein HanIR_Chr13g0661641 [Helianthus annuus]KAJ0499277.1 hypothetical protein HanHA89_Chr13g0532331 [Helianthus annuus]